jgi:predicted ATP-dependent endonuclease of OLD family
MKIKRLILKNFRIFKDETIIDFDDLTAFVGKNDIGKTTILDALDIFFNEKDAQVKLDKEDISKGSSSNDIVIGVVFEEYPQEIVIDTTVSTNLKEEYLLNKDNLLEIRKIFPNGDVKKVKTYIRAYHPSNEQLKDLLTLKISELKERAEKLGVDLSDEDKRIASVIRKKIRDHFKEEIQLEEFEIPIDEEGAKLIWNQIKNYLPLYALFKSDRQNVDQDAEVQDPMKIAIRKLLGREEIRTKLEEIKNEVEKEIVEIANRTIKKLEEMNPEIAQELKPKIPEPKWESVFKGITISSDEDIPLNKRGSGVRRLILLNFFRAEAEKKKEERNVPDVVYAFEEPETSQHPDYQKKLIEAFLSLSKREDTQIILTTHSPGIASLLPIESLRFLYKNNDGKVVVEKGSDEVLYKIAESLGVLPTVDKDRIEQLKLVVCVEGPTDVEFFKRLGKIIDDELKIDFENDKRVVIIPLGGSTLKHWVDNHYLRKLGKPEIHIYDGDKEENRRMVEEINNRGDGSRGFVTNKREIENYVHPNIVKDKFNRFNEI